MIKVEFFGIYRLNIDKESIEVEAKTVNEAINEIVKEIPQISKSELSKALIFLNEKPLYGIFRGRKKLKDNDNLMIMYPASGG